MPTDTVYGWPHGRTTSTAVQSVYRAKGRPEGMHLPVLAASLEQVRGLGVAFGARGAALARRWWPGPLTLVFGFRPRRRPVRIGWTAGTRSRCGSPTTTSCGRCCGRPGCSSSPAPTRTGRPRHAAAPRWPPRSGLGSPDWVDLVVDGGALTEVPSTLVNVRGPEPCVEREGRHLAATPSRNDALSAVRREQRLLLAIETSCDETAAAVGRRHSRCASSVVASQIDLHAGFGGVVPELASHAHVEMITPIVERALTDAGWHGARSRRGRGHRGTGAGRAHSWWASPPPRRSPSAGACPVVAVNHLEGHLASVYLADR